MILFLSYIQVALSTDCSTLTQNYLKIVGKQNEVITKPIASFFKNPLDQYELVDANKKLSIIDKIELIEKNDLLDQYQLKSIISFQVLESQNRVWINRFAVLGIKSDNQYTLITSENARQGTDKRLPNFNKEIILENQAITKYYGLVVIDLENIILDSSEFNQEQKIIQNYFYLIKQDQQIKILNTYPYTDLQQNRQLLVYKNYIFRGIPKTQNNPSIIQIFQFDKQLNEIKLIDTIDNIIIIDQIDYVFEMIEFKVVNERRLIILDKIGNLIQLDKTDKWNVNLLIKKSGECFSFDYNYYFQNLAVIQKNKILTQYNEYEFSFDLSSFKIHITNNYYILTSNTQIIQLNSHLQQNSKLNGDFSIILFDQNYDDTVIITNDFKVNHYQFQDNILLKYQNEELTSGTASITSNKCQITIDYQNIENDSQELILVNKNQILNEPLINQLYFEQYSNTNHQVDGPNYELYIESNSSNIASIQYMKEAFVSINNTLELDVIYFQIVQEKQQFLTYYMVTQFKNKTLQVQFCFSSSICYQKYPLIQLEFELNEFNTQLTTYSYTQLLVFLYNQNKITLIKYQQNGTYNKDEYVVEGIEVESIYLAAGYFLTLSIKQKTIEVYNVNFMKYLYQITSEDLQYLGISEWNPTKLFASQEQEYIYVQNDKNIIIIYLEVKQFTIVNTLNLPESKDVKIINWKKRFGILQQFENIELKIYNKQDLTQIYFEKSISFYDYKIENLNQFQWAENTGVLIVIAKKGNENVLLNYIIDGTAHNSLYQETKISDKNKFIRTLDYYIYYYNQDNIQTQVSQLVPQIVSKIEFNDQNFTIDVPVKLIYSNVKNFTIESKIRLANTQIKVFTDPSQIQANTNLTSRKQTKNLIDLGNRWYAGQVSQFSITSKQQSSIQITQPIEYLESNFANETIVISEIDNNTLFILKNTTYEIKKKTGEIYKNGAFPYNLGCYQILANTGDGRLVLKCTREGNSGIVVLGLKFDEDFQFSESTLEQDPYEAYFEGDLIFFVFYNSVKVYSGDILKIGELKLCWQEVFINEQQSIITVKYLYDNHYHIYNINDAGDLMIYEFNYNNGVFDKNNQISFSIEEQINEKYYKNSGATFQVMNLINIVLKDKQFSADYLFFSTEGPHYGINIQFKCSETYICIINYLEVKYIFQGYGQFQTQRSIYIKQDFIIIPYIPQIGQSQVISIYQIPKEIKENQPIRMLGALYPFDKSSKCSYEIYSANNETFLLINSALKTTFAKYKISTSPKLLFDGDIDSETVQITASNDYSTSSISLSIVTPDKPNDKVIWPWILVGVLSGCLLIGSIMYVYYKRKAKVEETLL